MAQPRTALWAHEARLHQRLEAGLRQLDGVRIVGSAAHKAPLSALHFTQAHPFDVAQFLDGRDIATRAGQHCAQPLLSALGVEGLLRISLAPYNTEAEVDHFLAALEEILEWLQ